MSRLKKVLKTGNSSWLRSIILVALVIAGVVLTVRNWDSVVQGLQILADVDAKWLFIAIFSVAFSLYAMAEVMRLLLRAGGVKAATRRSTNALTLASNAWAVTVPGGAAFSTALQIKRMMQWGASAVLVSWFVLFFGRVVVFRSGISGAWQPLLRRTGWHDRGAHRYGNCGFTSHHFAVADFAEPGFSQQDRRVVSACL